MLNNLWAKLDVCGVALRDFVISVVDLLGLRVANGRSARAQSVNWRRLGLLTLPVAGAIISLIIVLELTGPKAYPPPLPDTKEIKTRRALIEASSPTPPAILVERNKSVGASS